MNFIFIQIFLHPQEYVHRDFVCFKQLRNSAVFGKMWWNVWDYSEAIILVGGNSPFLYGSNINVVGFIIDYWKMIRSDFY